MFCLNENLISSSVVLVFYPSPNSHFSRMFMTLVMYYTCVCVRSEMYISNRTGTDTGYWFNVYTCAETKYVYCEIKIAIK